MGIVIFIVIVLILINISPDPVGSAANVIVFGIEVAITIALFALNPIIGIIAGYLFLRSWNE